MRRFLIAVSMMLGAFAIAGPGNAAETFDGSADAPPATNDPWESFNRSIFNFNVDLDRDLIRPIASAYHELPDILRRGINNELTNITEPLNAVHGVLQVNPKIFFTSTWRFILNTTYGLGGLRDFAGENGLHNTDQNLGKTLGRWGVGSGPYVVLPALGPSSVRGTVGKAGDFFLNPLEWYLTYPETFGIGAVNGIATRDRFSKVVDQFYYHSLDPYSAMRSAYLQNEAFEVSKHETVETPKHPYPEPLIQSQESYRQHKALEQLIEKE